MSICFPLNTEVVCSDRVARWRPLLNWVLVIPMYLWLIVLQCGAWVARVVAWFAIMSTGTLPTSLGDYLVAVLRYQWRVIAYLCGLTDRYPGFRVRAGYVDPGDNAAILYSARPVDRRRGTVAFRTFLIIPQVVVLYIVNLVAVVVLVFAWFAVLVTGRWPRSLQSWVIGWMRWTLRVGGYRSLLVDDYPPFGFQE